MCNEVCVCCLKVFKQVRGFVRHTEQHLVGVSSKIEYLSKRRDELRKDAAKELATRIASLGSSGKKRAQEHGDPGLQGTDLDAPGNIDSERGTKKRALVEQVDSRTVEAQIDGLDRFDATIAAPPDGRYLEINTQAQLAEKLPALLPPDMQAVTVLKLIEDNVGPSDLESISGICFPEDNFSAPVHDLRNFPYWQKSFWNNADAYKQY
jgi:hypothetical protein